MKILHTVQSYWPSVGGMQEVAAQLSARLAARGHDVTLATSKEPGRASLLRDGVHIEEFGVSGDSVHGLRGDVDGYRRFLLESRFDIVANFAAQQWATDVALPILDKIYGRKVFVPTGFSGLFAPEFKEYFSAMKRWMRGYDANVFLSDRYRDIEFARENGITGLHVIPNAAAAEEFLPAPSIDIRQRLDIGKSQFLILLVGSHTGLKGHQESFDIFRRARIRNATLLFVANHFGGGCLKDCRRKAVLFPFTHHRWFEGKRFLNLELTRVETVAAYQGADLFLFPSQIECSPLVLFESMASRTPFLTTPAGNAAEIIEWSHGGKLLPSVTLADGRVRADVDPSARMLETMARNPDERRKLAEAGFAAWRERFTWDIVTSQYETLYQNLLKP